MLKQITVYAENKKGTMKDITGILASTISISGVLLLMKVLNSVWFA